MNDASGFLKHSPLFAELDPDALRRLEALARKRDVKGKIEIFHKGDPATEFYGILAGAARITTPSHDGKDLVIRRLGPGDVFGEIAIFDKRPRTATVKTTEPTTLAVIDSRDLKAHLRSHPDVAIALLGLFAERLRLTTRHLEDSVFLKIEERLAKTLLQLAAEIGDETPNGLLIREPLSQSLLAQMVGANREAVNRQIKTWESDSWLRQRGGLLELLKLDAFQTLSHEVRD